MIRCGVTKEIYCEYRRKGNCENTQDPCPCEIVSNLFEEGKSIDYIVNVTNYNELEINTILQEAKLIK